MPSSIGRARVRVSSVVALAPSRKWYSGVSFNADPGGAPCWSRRCHLFRRRATRHQGNIRRFLGQCFFDGQTLRLELCSTRLDEAKAPPAKPTGKRHVVARIVLTPRGAVELLSACNQIAAAFKQAEILKETPGPPAPEKKEIPASTAKPTDGKSPIDNLEREVASLLRPDKKPSDDRRL